MALYVIECLFLLFLVTGATTQVVIPIFKAERLFPLFRSSDERRRKREEKRRLQQIAALEGEEQLLLLEELANEKRKRLEARQQNYDPLRKGSTAGGISPDDPNITRVVRIREK